MSSSDKALAKLLSFFFYLRSLKSQLGPKRSEQEKRIFLRSESYFELALNTCTSCCLKSKLTHILCLVYLLASAAGGLQREHSCRLIRVTTFVS
jgi:hypothetical protein